MEKTIRVTGRGYRTAVRYEVMNLIRHGGDVGEAITAITKGIVNRFAPLPDGVAPDYWDAVDDRIELMVALEKDFHNAIAADLAAEATRILGRTKKNRPLSDVLQEGPLVLRRGTRKSPEKLVQERKVTE